MNLPQQAALSGHCAAASSGYPVLYSFRRCPYAMRARLAIAASKQICELREVILRDKPQALLDASSKATVPVLVDIDGQVIDQSLDIMSWALRRQDPQAWLTPPRHNLASMLELIAQCDGDFKHDLDRYKYPQRFEDANRDQHRDHASQWLHGLNSRLEQAPFLFGERASLADMAIAPFVRQFAHTDMAWFQTQPWPHLQAWLQDWLDSQLFQSIMRKYPPWSSETGGVLFPEIG